MEGVIVMSVSVAVVTVSWEVPDMLPSDAVIVVEPTATGVASPMEPAALLTVATVVVDELQLTRDVRSWVEPSS